MARLRHTLQALRTGLVDGWTSPQTLESGLTFPDYRLSDLYDHAANLGQNARHTLALLHDLYTSPEPRP